MFTGNKSSLGIGMTRVRLPWGSEEGRGRGSRLSGTTKTTVDVRVVYQSSLQQPHCLRQSRRRVEVELRLREYRGSVNSSRPQTDPVS